ncbi:MAG: response regulator transcription factor [Anaerohalosphaera sp.]|nr:response regulator transcription factor [Anaerohalosphaera sp.]
MSIRILIADEFEVVREGVRSFLEILPDMEVVGQAADGRMAVQLAHESRPDILILDSLMPVLNGIDTARQIARELPGIKIVAFSAHLENRNVREMFKAGAIGYVSKYGGCQELIAAIESVASGKVYLSPSITSLVIEGFVHRSQDDVSPYSLLTAKERQVLQLLAEGKTTKEVAHELNISAKAVEWRRSKTMHKLNVHNIAELVKYAIREEIISVHA